MRRSDAEEPEEKENGDEQKQRVLPVVVVVAPVVVVTVGLVIGRILICSVKRVVGVEDCCEEAERKRSDPKRHVEPCVSQTLEHPSPAPALGLCPLTLRSRRSF